MFTGVRGRGVPRTSRRGGSRKVGGRVKSLRTAARSTGRPTRKPPRSRPPRSKPGPCPLVPTRSAGPTRRPKRPKARRRDRPGRGPAAVSGNRASRPEGEPSREKIDVWAARPRRPPNNNSPASPSPRSRGAEANSFQKTSGVLNLSSESPTPRGESAHRTPPPARHARHAHLRSFPSFDAGSGTLIPPSLWAGRG